jgi:hypothetical protein
MSLLWTLIFTSVPVGALVTFVLLAMSGWLEGPKEYRHRGGRARRGSRGTRSRKHAPGTGTGKDT